MQINGSEPLSIELFVEINVSKVWEAIKKSQGLNIINCFDLGGNKTMNLQNILKSLMMSYF